MFQYSICSVYAYNFFSVFSFPIRCLESLSQTFIVTMIFSLKNYCNKNRASDLEAVILGGDKKILEYSSKTCNKAVRGDMGLDLLSSRWDRAKLTWWHKLCGDWYPRLLFDLVWEVKPCRGRQRKMWGKRVDDIVEALLSDKEELLEDIQKGKSI